MVVKANYSFSKPYPVGGAQYTALYVFVDSESSPRVNGKLAYRANPVSISKVSSRRWNAHGGGPAPFVYPNFLGTTNDPKVLRAQAIAESQLRAKLKKKIYSKNVGALGVSIASAKQSIAMMQSSAEGLTRIIAGASQLLFSPFGRRRLKRIRRLYRRGGKVTAGMVLEGMFGWQPLLEDFSSACRTLADPWPPGWVSAKQRYEVGPVYLNSFDEVWTRQSNRWSVAGHVAFATKVTVSNPNLWVAQKLGLVNPFQVAWDLIPWSFLVNMFSNMGQIMGSLTDFAGLGLSETSMTSRLYQLEEAQINYRDPRPGAFSSGGGVVGTLSYRRTVGGNPPEVTPYLRFPEWSVGTAAIAGSLLIQRASKLDRDLFSNIPDGWA